MARADQLTSGALSPVRRGGVEATAVVPRLLAGVADLFVGDETLVQGAGSVLETLLHEAVHGAANVSWIRDASFQGRHHMPTTRRWGEAGPGRQQHLQVGWSLSERARGRLTSIVDRLTSRYGAGCLRYAESPVPVLSGEPGGADRAAGNAGGARPALPPPKNGLVLVCVCPKPRILRASVAVVELGPIVCGVCGAGFGVVVLEGLLLDAHLNREPASMSLESTSGP